MLLRKGRALLHSRLMVLLCGVITVIAGCYSPGGTQGCNFQHKHKAMERLIGGAWEEHDGFGVY